MKQLSVFGLVCIISALVTVLSSSTAFAGAKTITLTNTDKYKNEIRFVSEAPIEKITGTAESISGSFSIDLQNLPATNGKLTVPVNSMATGSSSRDSHMFATEWMDEAHYKTISYNLKSLTVENVESTPGVKTIVTGVAKGEFTMHGVTKPVEAKVKITYLNESNSTKQITAGDLVLVQVDFTVSLKAHNILGKAGLVGNKVGEQISISATLFGSSAAH